MFLNQAILSGRLHVKFVEKKNRIRFAGGSSHDMQDFIVFYPVHHANFVDLANPVFLYTRGVKRFITQFTQWIDGFEYQTGVNLWRALPPELLVFQGIVFPHIFERNNRLLESAFESIGFLQFSFLIGLY